MNILILCTGNSCRSQMAHGFLRSFDSRLYIESAGTRPEAFVNPKAVRVMSESGIDISGHKPKHIDQFIEAAWDYVITVCGNASENCPVFSGNVKNKIHIGFDDPTYANGDEAFIKSEFYRVRDEIKHTFFKFYNENLKKQLK